MNQIQVLTAVGLVASLAPCLSQTVVSTNALSARGGVEQTMREIKNPVWWFIWGGDLRFRNEYFNNALSLGVPAGAGLGFGSVHAQDYLRFRGRVWGSLFPTNDLTLNVRLAAEPREFIDRSTFDTFYQEEGPQWRYGIFDTLNVRWKEPGGLPASVTIGRQDIFLGDGWLVGDGTPEDGSFTTFLDSARIIYKIDDWHTTINAIGIDQSARPDAWLPTIGQATAAGAHVEPLTVTDQDEKGAILWVANNYCPAANVDGYFIYKNDTRLNDYPVPTFGDNADIYTTGGRVFGATRDWKYSVEGAYQFGRKQDPDLNMAGANPYLAPSAQTTDYRTLDAFGVNAKLTYVFHDRFKEQLSLNYEYLSGDDPKTGGDEMFDVLWGRWPRWSEMYNIYSYVQETRVGQTANLHRIGPTWLCDPTPKLELSASYYALLADQSAPTRDLSQQPEFPPSASPFSGTGTFRGHYFQGIIKYKFNEHLSGHLWSEFLLPGDFYVSRNLIAFLRAELMVTF